MGSAKGPTVTVPHDAWNADRLNSFLSEIDTAISESQYARAVTLSYTCLEGFLTAFARSKSDDEGLQNELISLSRWVKEWLKNSINDYPDEVLNLLNHISYTVDRTRNQFSDAHFAGEAGLWLALYIRDLVNSQIRMLLHFM